MSDNKKLKGVVKWFNDAKGFGFIQHPSGKDVFVHYSSIEADGFKTLKDGEEVLYEIEEGAKGLHATRVQRIAPPQEASSEKSEEAQKSGDESTSDSQDEALTPA